MRQQFLPIPMKLLSVFLLFFGCISVASNVGAQNKVGPLTLDPSFAANGVSEVNFSGFNDEVTSFVAYRGTPFFIVAGKLSTATPGAIRFGMLSYDPTGKLSGGFGSGGKADLSWGAIDYPNTVALVLDGSVLCSGATSSTPDPASVLPALFRIKANGTPDSTFGTNGRVQVAVGTPAGGEFESIDTIKVSQGSRTVLRIVASGHCSGAQTGFLAARFDSTGALDTTFGARGISVIPAQVTRARGFVMRDQSVIVAGISQTAQPPVILLAKFTKDGAPDSTFGVHGLLNTGIALHDGNTFLAMPPTDSTVMVLASIGDDPAHLPFTLVRFRIDGTLDTSYASTNVAKGFASSPLTAGILPRGIKISNDGSTLICGSIDLGLGQSVATKFFKTGFIDTTFGTKGVALLDPDNGLRKNYLVGFNSASLGPGTQRFIGIGISVSASGNTDFLLARYKPVPSSVASKGGVVKPELQVFPNPARGSIQVETSDNSILRLAVTDVLGRIVHTILNPTLGANANTCSLDVSGLTSGIYVCTLQTNAGLYSQRFTVTH